ncbi:MaoC family dehydratase N-terminal domain-containing protein [Xanthobacter sp.]|uniref:FAS1-like dehydratase domain-containing protein n=1 Tax=Xanthobacter sp. TaxID=35809 RepID=UPI0035AEAA6D
MTDVRQLDLALLRSWIGREETAEEVVTHALAERFRATFGEGRGTAEASATAPRMLHWCLAPPAVPMGELGADGHPARGGFLPPVPLPRRMWAGGDLVFHGEILAGDAVRRTSRIADVSVKEGRSGLLCFVTVCHEVSANGRAVLSETQEIVYRDHPAADAGPARGGAPAAEGEHRRSIDPSAVLLFRYSALTFNGHRIHYDLPYATRTEGYPGLVVQGPLQATLLARFAEQIHGAPPSRFSFRGLAPAYSGTPLVLHAQSEDGGLKLWSAVAGGPVSMSARADW